MSKKRPTPKRAPTTAAPPTTLKAPEPQTTADLILTDEAAYQTLKWVLDGQHERDILEAIGHKYPNADPRKTLDAVMDHLTALAGADPTILRGFAMAAYREIYCRALTIGDFANAIRCVKELSNLAGRR